MNVDADIRKQLRQIGHQLNRDIFPRICNGGYVNLSMQDGNDRRFKPRKTHERSRTRRSTAGTWQGTTRGQRPANRPRSSGAASPVINQCISEKYKSNLHEVAEAYPGAVAVSTSDCIWLRTDCLLLSGLDDSATVISVLPLYDKSPRSWGFWSDGTWVGPRHTNFPDGSICSFEPSDNTWAPGDSIVALLDLHTLWLLRHLHYRCLGWWPGSQCVRHPYERIAELKSNEKCGCDKRSGKSYKDCCQLQDENLSLLRLAVNFTITHDGGIRQLPASVRKLMHSFSDPPSFSQLESQLINLPGGSGHKMGTSHHPFPDAGEAMLVTD